MPACSVSVPSDTRHRCACVRVCVCVRARIGYADTQGVRFLATALRQTTVSDCVAAVSQKSRETTGETWLCLELGMKSPAGIEETTVKGSLVGVGLLYNVIGTIDINGTVGWH